MVLTNRYFYNSYSCWLIVGQALNCWQCRQNWMHLYVSRHFILQWLCRFTFHFLAAFLFLFHFCVNFFLIQNYLLNMEKKFFSKCAFCIRIDLIKFKWLKWLGDLICDHLLLVNDDNWMQFSNQSYGFMATIKIEAFFTSKLIN